MSMKATNRTETDDIQSLLAIARRLADVQAKPPIPLVIHRADRQRDGPSEWYRPGLAPPTRSGAARHSQTYSSGISHRSRGMKP